MRKLLLTLTVVVATLLVAGASPSVARAQDAAVAVNTRDGSSVFKLAFHIRRVATDVVDQTNAAVAYASCTECQTIAISIQIVLVMTDPSIVTPTNVAIAINEACSLCDTLASAYQFVIGGQPMELTKDAKERLKEIKKALKALRDSGLAAAEIQAELDVLMAEVSEILSTGLVPRRPGREEEADEAEEETSATETTKTETAPTETTETTETTDTTETTP